MTRRHSLKVLKGCVKDKEFVSSACEVDAEEREGGEKINHDESHNTIDRAYREVVQPLSLIESNDKNS